MSYISWILNLHTPAVSGVKLVGVCRWEILRVTSTRCETSIFLSDLDYSS